MTNLYVAVVFDSVCYVGEGRGWAGSGVGHAGMAGSAGIDIERKSRLSSRQLGNQQLEPQPHKALLHSSFRSLQDFCL